MKKFLFSIIILAFLALGAYVFFKKPLEFSFSNDVSKTPRPSVTPTAESITHKNLKYWFEISYPVKYEPNEGAHPDYNVGEFFVGPGESVFTVSLPENSYEGTNFFEGFLTVSVANQEAETSCQKARREGDSDLLNLSPAKSINGLSFYQGETSGAAAGTLAKTKIFHAFKNNLCYEITLNLFEGNLSNYPEGTVVQFDENDAFGKLEAVLDSFRLDAANQSEAESFVKNYLTAYQNLETKNNFEAVKRFLSQDQLDYMVEQNMPLETNYTKFDRYELLSIEKIGKLYVATVKLFNGGEILKQPEGKETAQILISEKSGQLKSESWYFAQ